MYVVIFNPKQGETQQFHGQLGNGRDTEYFEYSVRIIPSGESNRSDYGIDPLKERKMFFCEHEQYAKSLAKKLAEDNPSAELLVLTEKYIYQSIPPKEKIEVVEKIITAEGVLPQ